MEKKYKGLIVNSNGTVWKNGKEVGTKPNKLGYCTITVKLNKRNKCVGRYRIVWEAFNGKIPKGYEIDHKNCIRNDDRLENLRCVTHKENMNNPLTVSHIKESVKATVKFGNTCFGNKPKKVEKYKDGLLVSIYKSIHQASINDGISSFDIYNSNNTNQIVNGYIYKIKDATD